MRLHIPKMTSLGDSYSEELIRVMQWHHDMPFFTAVESAWVLTSILSLIEKSKEEGRPARLIWTLPEGEGFDTFIIHPDNTVVREFRIPEIKYDENYIESKDLNSLLYISSWQNCDFHKDQPPDLELIVNSDM